MRQASSTSRHACASLGRLAAGAAALCLLAAASTVLAFTAAESLRSSSRPPDLSTLAKPQSTTWTSPKAPTMTLDGFRSRCTTPRE